MESVPAALRHPMRMPLSQVLFAIAILALAGHFVLFLRGALAAVRYPFELDYGEGIVWQQAMLIPGPRMYGDITQFPFIVFHYPPVYHLAVRAVAALGIDPLLAGRGISLASSLLTGLLAAMLAFRATRTQTGRMASLAGGTVAGLTFFCFFPVVFWSPLMRVDMLAIALGFLGVWCATASVRRPWLLYLAMVLFVLAAFTKQTCLSAPAATMAVMLLVNREHALKVCAFGLALGLAALGLLTWATHGGFLRHIVLYNLNRFTLRAIWTAMRPESPQIIFFALAAIAVVTGWKPLTARARSSGDERFLVCMTLIRRDLAASEPVRMMAILTLYLALATGSLITLGKSGSTANYLIEWMGILSVLIGMLVARVITHDLPAAPRSLAASALPAALLLQTLILPATWYTNTFDPARTRQLYALQLRIKAARRPVLSDDMVLLMKAGKQVPMEPSIFAELASTGRWDERRIIDMIDNHAFAFVLTQARIEKPTDHARYTKAVARAIETAYPRTEQQAGLTIHLPPGPAR